STPAATATSTSTVPTPPRARTWGGRKAMKRIGIVLIGLALVAPAFARADDKGPPAPDPKAAASTATDKGPPAPDPKASTKPPNETAQIPGTVAPDVTATYHSGSFTLGGQAVDVNNDSSKFQEYREVPQGVVAPGFHLFGRTPELKYDFQG